MQTRLKEAELQRSSSYQSYQVALQNMNVLMGLEPVSYTHLDVYKRQTFLYIF